MNKELKIVAIFSILTVGIIRPVSAESIVLKSSVDKTTIAQNENFTLTVEVSGEKANAAADPQIPDINDFAVYLGSSGVSQNIQIINGQMTVSKSHSYIFRAVTLGKFTIPAAVLKFNGKEYRSNPINIEITKASPQKQPHSPRTQPSRPAEQDSETIDGENLFLRVQASKKTAYVNEPIIVSYKIYTRVTVTQYGINKLPNTAGFWAEEYELGTQPKIYEEVYNGKSYRVALIRRLALFPTDAGKKTIDPMEIECNVRVQTRRRSIFDSFFDDPFFGRSVRKLVSSAPLTVNVLPLPDHSKPANFSGLVGNFDISSFIDKTSVKTNEAIALKIEISGSGNIKMIPTPQVDLPVDFEQYPPKLSQKINRNESGVSGSKFFEYVLVPRHAGVHTIKPVEFSYFDIQSQQYRTVRTGEIQVAVEKSDDDLVSYVGGRGKEDIKYFGEDIRFIRQGAVQFYKINSNFYQSFIFIVLMIAPILALGAAAGYRRHQDKMSGNIAYARSRKANQLAMKKLARAKKLMAEQSQKEFYAEISHSLMGFLADKLNISAAGIITDEVEELMKKNSVAPDVVTQYLACLKMCDYQRFAPSTAKLADMKSFFNEAKQAIISLEKVI